ncbi:MAG: hypothetical protein WA974_15620 [Thermodesulfobacteriota bacterium]
MNNKYARDFKLQVLIALSLGFLFAENAFAMHISEGLLPFK